MALKNKGLKKSLTERAVENTQVTRGTSSNQTVLKKGIPNDHSAKHFNSDVPVVGVSIGSTLNMDNYESLRADVWLTDVVADNETVEQAYQRIINIVDETLQGIVSQYKE